jgi:hypothetical protein
VCNNAKSAKTRLTEARTSPLRLLVEIHTSLEPNQNKSTMYISLPSPTRLRRRGLVSRTGLQLHVLERERPTPESGDELLLRVLKSKHPTLESRDGFLLLVLEHWPSGLLRLEFR